ncbi:tetratricopeptide repeat protein, partial [Actinoplanes sp. NPDC051633]|uniref:tetratricopeptide repeat protein n=1 Tax=Actinoplanes sp. NPDC051633 TaxID=3155670 RepID=UPI0034304120
LATGMSFGNALREMGQFDTALHYCGQAAEGYATAMGAENPLVQAARVNIAAIHLARGDGHRAAEILDAALDALTGRLGERHPFTVLATVNRAGAASMVDPASAPSWWARAYERSRDVFGGEHLDTLLTAAGLAADRPAGTDEDGSRPGLDQVLAVLRRRFGAGHALVTRVAEGSRIVVDIELPSA